MSTRLHAIDEFMIGMAFDHYNSCIQSIESALDKEAEAAAAALDEPLDHIRPEYQHLYESQRQGELDFVAGMLPPIVYRTMLASSWSMFEHCLITATQNSLLKSPPSGQMTTKLKKKINGIRDLTAVKDYWEKEKKVTFQVGWDEIESIKAVRNLIIHDNSRRHEFDPSDIDATELTRHTRTNDIEKYLAKRAADNKTGLSFQRDELMVTADYCKEVTGTLKTYLTGLAKATDSVDPNFSESVVSALYPTSKK